MNPVDLIRQFSISSSSLGQSASSLGLDASATEWLVPEKQQQLDQTATDVQVKYLRRKLKQSLKEEQRLLKKHMELLLLRRDIKAKIEKREVEEMVSKIWKQKEKLDEKISSV